MADVGALVQGLVSHAGGEGGIRTRERLAAPTRFPVVPVRPLRHLSALHEPRRMIRSRVRRVACAVSGGESGIRTHGGGSPHNGFRDRRLKPLSHLSVPADSIMGWCGSRPGRDGHRFLDTPLISSVPSQSLKRHPAAASPGAFGMPSGGAAVRSALGGEKGSRPESVADAQRDGCLDSHRAGSGQGHSHEVVPA